MILNRKFRFKFSKSREYKGKIKQVIIKRSRVGEYYLIIVTDANPKEYRKTHNGASVGIDFGLKMYLTMSDGSEYSNPLFFKQYLSKIRQNLVIFQSARKEVIIARKSELNLQDCMRTCIINEKTINSKLLTNFAKVRLYLHRRFTPNWYDKDVGKKNE